MYVCVFPSVYVAALPGKATWTGQCTIITVDDWMRDPLKIRFLDLMFLFWEVEGPRSVMLLAF